MKYYRAKARVLRSNITLPAKEGDIITVITPLKDSIIGMWFHDPKGGAEPIDIVTTPALWVTPTDIGSLTKTRTGYNNKKYTYPVGRLIAGTVEQVS